MGPERPGAFIPGGGRSEVDRRSSERRSSAKRFAVGCLPCKSDVANCFDWVGGAAGTERFKQGVKSSLLLFKEDFMMVNQVANCCRTQQLVHATMAKEKTKLAIIPISPGADRRQYRTKPQCMLGQRLIESLHLPMCS